MNWRRKSRQFRFISSLPGGMQLYNFIQEHITHSTLATRLRVENKVQVGLEFWRWLQQAGRADQLLQGHLLDLGAGWHPSIPLLWYAFGNNQQTLVDVHPNMDGRKVHDTIRFFLEIVQESGWIGRDSLRRLPALGVARGPAAGALQPLAMRYHAPYNGLLRSNPATYDMVLCTQVLQHIPKPVQLEIFKDLNHCLKPGGLFHATVHFVGQFSSPFLQSGQFEHLSFSTPDWEQKINSPLMSFNRLKAPDYRETLEQAGFRILAFDPVLPTEADLAELKRTSVDSSFDRYTRQELATRGLFFVAEKV